MIEGVIFDLDGTLLNTLIDLTNAVNYGLNSVGISSIDINKTRNIVGNGIKNLMSKALGENNLDKFDIAFKNFKDYYDLHQKDNTIPYDGIIDLLSKLYSKNIKMGIVSNKYQFGVTNLCVDLFGKYIDQKAMIGSETNFPLKPNPYMVYKSISALNLTSNQCLFVGDSNIDIETANNANMKVCAVTWGYKDKEFLEKLNINYLISKPDELINIIEKENSKND